MNTTPKYCDARKGFVNETLFCNCGDPAKYEAKKQPASIFIEVLYWYDKTYGNTYWASTVHIDGVAVFETPFAYGHGESSIKTWIGQRLHDYGVVSCDEYQTALWYLCQEKGVTLYFSSKEAKQRELKALGRVYGSLEQFRLVKKGN